MWWWCAEKHRPPRGGGRSWDAERRANSGNTEFGDVVDRAIVASCYVDRRPDRGPRRSTSDRTLTGGAARGSAVLGVLRDPGRVSRDLWGTCRCLVVPFSLPPSRLCSAALLSRSHARVVLVAILRE